MAQRPVWPLRLAGLCLVWLVVSCDRPMVSEHPPADPAVEASTPPVGQPMDEPPAAVVDPSLVDVADEVGIDFVHDNGMSGERYFVEPVGSGAALFDMDGDADLDLYLVQGHPLGDADPGPGARPRDRLYRNDLDRGEGLSFTDVTEESGILADGYGMGVAAGDFDADGWVDLYVTNWGPNQLWRNLGGGRFEDVTESSGTDLGSEWSTSASFVDFDRDADLDLFVVQYVRFDYDLHHPCYERVTGTQDYCGPSAYVAYMDRLLRNDGAGHFEEVSTSAGLQSAFGPGLGVTTADFDRDGWVDIYVANDGSANQLWMNQGNGRLEDRAMISGSAVNGAGAPEAGMGVVAEDFDHDADTDLFMAHLSSETNTYYENQGDGLFRDRSRETGLGPPSRETTAFGIGLLDLDADGWLDLYLANGEVRIDPIRADAGDPFPLAQADGVYHNLGAGRFEDWSTRAGPDVARPAVSRGVASGDVDNDGDRDLVIVDNNGPLRLLINPADADRQWLGLRVTDSSGRLDLTGTILELMLEDGRRLERRAHRDGSYLSSNDPRVLFGLSRAAPIASLRARWPDGSVEVWTDLVPGAYRHLPQGSGRAVLEP